MWKLWNKLFGWQYVSVRSQTLDYRYIERVYLTPEKEPYVLFAGNKAWFLLPEGKVDNGYSWKALT